jgi:hypothetical protein
MRGSNAVNVVAVSRPDSPVGSRLAAGSSKTAAAVVVTAAAKTEALVAAEAMVAVAVDSKGTGPPHLGEPYIRMAAKPPPTAVTCMMGPLRGPGCASTITATAARAPDANRPAYSSWETGQQLSTLQSVAADGHPHLHPTTKLILPECRTIHTFSGHAKLCIIRDEKSNKDFLVYTGATLSLVPFQSAAAATGQKLQAVNTGHQDVEFCEHCGKIRSGIYVYFS